MEETPAAAAVLTRRRIAGYFAPAVVLVGAVGFLMWRLGLGARSLAAPLPVLLLWFRIARAIPPAGLVPKPVSVRLGIGFLAWLFVGLGAAAIASHAGTTAVSAITLFWFAVSVWFVGRMKGRGRR